MAVDTKDGRTPEQRLRLIEDRFEIYNLIASHPPSADTGAGNYTASVWTEDGVFDRGAEFARPTGRAAIAGGSSNPEHHRAIEQGIAHFAGLPYVRITGDTAFAISYLQILVPDRVGPLFDVPNHGSSRGIHVHRDIRGKICHLVFELREGADVMDAALLVERRHRFGPHHLAARVSANRWEFVRTDEGWKIRRRTLRPLDGTEPAREILGGALGP